jgi:ABC-type multidrug transport system fused ATPase/permease subunit
VSTFEVFARALRFVAPVRGRFAVKALLTALSFVPMLVLPVPIKLLVDHVIGNLSLAERIESFPFLARPFLRLIADAPPLEILFWTLAAQVVLLLAIGQIGSDGGERDRTDAWLASGVDTATGTENSANAGFSFAGGLFGLFDFRYTLRLTQDLNHGFRARLFERIQSLSLASLDDASIGDAVYRLMYDTPSITLACYRIILVPSLAPLGLALYTYALWDTFHLPGLALSAAALGPVVFAMTFPFARLVREQGARSRAAGATATAALEEGVANVLAVQTQSGERRERERFDRASLAAFARERGLMALAMLAIAAASVPGAWLLRRAFLGIVDAVIEGRISLGDFALLVTYFAQICVFSVLLGGFWFALQTAAPGLARVFELLDRAPEEDAVGAEELEHPVQSLRFEKVDFDHAGGAGALRDVSFEARRGRVTALVGPAGAGKTTLLYHVPRFLSPARGRVLVDERDVAGLTRASLRAQIAFVFQENALFEGTLEDNVRVGKPGATRVELERAAQLAGADEFIAQLPDGWATRLGRSGAGLSVGQKQRLAIARALLRDAPILILDEPTSALDRDTEKRLLGSLREIARERIVLVVAHRLSTARQADEILFLRDGQIVERGTHADLVTRPEGAYHHFVEASN